jgi:predicted O-methyltransferase YrrM
VILDQTKQVGFAMASDELTNSFLRTLVASRPEGRILELGTGAGVATSWLFDGLSAGATLLTIDGNPVPSAIAKTCFGSDPRQAFRP